MSQPIIEVRALSKRYRLGSIGATSLREEFSRRWDRLRGRPHPDAKEFWALRDVSFDIQPGEVVGVIGRNGSGKSTLLKILSRITEPTSGVAKLRGRVASLLEVGTGFHPELTGRENVFLNGALLGMTRAEVRRKFDEITAFAEVERFIDTPVKRYSSGMYVRLAFAVAAHLEPEILIVDEVLAVGDAQFQKKCLGKMQDVSRSEGRTVLFVSHNLPSVQQLCTHGLLLDAGRVEFDGPIAAAIARYQQDQPLSTEYVRPATPDGDAHAAVVTRAALREVDALADGRVLRLDIETLVHGAAISNVQIAVRVSTLDGTAIFTTTDSDASRQLGTLVPGRHSHEVDLPLVLAPGRYSVIIAICQPQLHVFDCVDGKLLFEIGSEHSLRLLLNDDRAGLVEFPVTWRHRHQA